MKNETLNNKWQQMPLWKKRMHGFLTYQFCAFASLLFPVETDLAVRDCLNEQFKDDDT